MATAFEVILTEDSEAGRAGEIRKVKPGFARNYLLPRGLAVLADAYQMRAYQEKKEGLERAAEEKRQKAEAVKEQLGEDSAITIETKAGASGKLFGAITKERVAQEASAQLKVKITKDQVVIKFPIKELGEYKVDLELGTQISTTILVKVVAEKH